MGAFPNLSRNVPFVPVCPLLSRFVPVPGPKKDNRGQTGTKWDILHLPPFSSPQLSCTRQRKRDDNKNKICAFQGGWAGGQRGKLSKNAICHGKRHDNKILKVKILLSRNFVVMAHLTRLRFRNTQRREKKHGNEKKAMVMFGAKFGWTFWPFLPRNPRFSFAVPSNCPELFARTFAWTLPLPCFFLSPIKEGCGGLGGEKPGAFPKAPGPIFQQPFSLPENAQALAGIAFRAAGKSVYNTLRSETLTYRFFIFSN